jgi:hypothetical protein
MRHRLKEVQLLSFWPMETLLTSLCYVGPTIQSDQTLLEVPISSYSHDARFPHLVIFSLVLTAAGGGGGMC